MGVSLTALDADLRQGLQELEIFLAQNGLQTRLTSTVRSSREQKFLYDRYTRGMSDLPAAPPGHSAHEYGWAFDLVVTPYDYQTDVGNAWQNLWGGTWGGSKDPVHFELPGASQLAWKLGDQSGTVPANTPIQTDPYKSAGEAFAQAPWFVQLLEPWQLQLYNDYPVVRALINPAYPFDRILSILNSFRH
jgi:hypothetical protein